MNKEISRREEQKQPGNASQKSHGQSLQPSNDRLPSNVTRRSLPLTSPDQQRKQTKVPKFGEWENEESKSYTLRFENVRHDPTLQGEGHGLKEKRAKVPPRHDPTLQGQGHGLKEGRAKVPQFGEWESQEGGGGYTEVFKNIKKKKPGQVSSGPQYNREVGSTAQEGRAKVPQLDNAKKSKNLREGGINPNNEPQIDEAQCK